MAYIIESSDIFMAQFNSVHLAVEPDPDAEDTGVKDSFRSLNEERIKEQIITRNLIKNRGTIFMPLHFEQHLWGISTEHVNGVQIEDGNGFHHSLHR
jgi:hypothetical protein